MIKNSALRNFLPEKVCVGGGYSIAPTPLTFESVYNIIEVTHRHSCLYKSVSITMIRQIIILQFSKL